MLLSHLIGTYFEECDRDDECYIGYVLKGEPNEFACMVVNDYGDRVLITYVQYCFDPDGQHPPVWNFYTDADGDPQMSADNGGCDIGATIYKKEAS